MGRVLRANDRHILLAPVCKYSTSRVKPISNHDVIVCYAGHVTHDVGAEPPGEFGHICGPDLKPVNW